MRGSLVIPLRLYMTMNTPLSPNLPQWLTDFVDNGSASYTYYGEGGRARSVGEWEGNISTPRRLEDWRVPDVADAADPPPSLASTLSARHTTDREDYRARLLSGSG